MLSPHSVFVSGCFDLPHAGHVQFLESAAQFGDLIVAIGSDRTIMGLKGRPPVMGELERLCVVASLRMVKHALIATGTGVLDFAAELREFRPATFVVNDDGHAACKEALCRELGIDYVVLPRQPRAGLAAQSTSGLRQSVALPYRVDLAGGWLDQPFVSSLHPGCVVVASVVADRQFGEHSGMATSTRKTARALWGDRLPSGDPVELARLLFGAENPPGKSPIAGSQDALGIALPGVSRLDYDGGYWPSRVESVVDDSLLDWLASLLWLYPLAPRAADFDVFAGRDMTATKASALSEAADRAWRALLAKDAERLGRAVWDSFQAQLALFPSMMTRQVEETLRRVRGEVAGCKLTGAGGGGYLLLVARDPPHGCHGLQIRRQMF